MKKALLFAVLSLLILSGCGELGQPGDINPAATKDEQAGGGNLKFAVTTPTPFKPQAPLVMETAVNLLGAEAGPLQPGQAIQSGALTFTLQKVQADQQKTAIGYQVSGLPADYAPMPGLGNPWIVLPNGKRLEVVEGGGGGGGSQGSESSNYDFPALPAGTKEFSLVIINSWSGAVQTWTVPVRLSN